MNVIKDINNFIGDVMGDLIIIASKQIKIENINALIQLR